VRTSVYSIQDLEARLEEILESVRQGEHVVVCEEGRQVAEIRPVPEVTIDDGLRELLERGVIGPLVKPEGTLEPIAERPGALARFLESR
jgi:antitoxin (DNA-binding transcriptional repressor) of toxin-antitoxin stability system